METECGTTGSNRTSMILVGCSFMAIAAAESCIIVVGFLWKPPVFEGTTCFDSAALLLFLSAAAFAALGARKARRLYEKVWGLAGVVSALAGVGFSLWVLYRIHVVTSKFIFF